MAQLHKRLNDDQVRLILQSYLQKELSLSVAMAQLSVKRSRFFELLTRFQAGTETFTTAYRRSSPTHRIDDAAHQLIIEALHKQKELIENKDLPINTYNYSAIKDALRDKHKTHVSLSAIVKRAKEEKCYLPRRERAVHDREVITRNIGELIQHDSSHHLWSPYAEKKWYLITSIDDCSRRLLYADFFETETSWAHISSVKEVVLNFGVPLKYYADQHAIFRFVKDRDKQLVCNESTKFTDDVDPQWRQVLKRLSIEPIYALSPQAKGKIERPYRWLQDRMVRRCAEDHVTTIQEGKEILQDEMNRYNSRQVHSTTKEIPVLRFERLQAEGSTLFRPFTVSKPYDPIKDIFCLKAERVVDSYRKISLFNTTLTVSKVPPRYPVTIHLVPDQKTRLIEVRLWWKDTLVNQYIVRGDEMKGVHF